MMQLFGFESIENSNYFKGLRREYYMDKSSERHSCKDCFCKTD